jgi:beta-lactamase superfamily II metal-dependent hydrolase
MYSGKLPTMNEIAQLSTRMKSYPARRADVVRTARMWSAPSHTIAFLREFPPEYTFASRSSLVHLCELRAQQIRKAWESPKQTTLV